MDEKMIREETSKKEGEMNLEYFLLPTKEKIQVSFGEVKRKYELFSRPL